MDSKEHTKVTLVRVKETKWKGIKATELGNGFKLFYTGADGRRNEVAVILNDEMNRGVVTVE